MRWADAPEALARTKLVVRPVYIDAYPYSTPSFHKPDHIIPWLSLSRQGMKLNDRPFDEQVAAVLDNLGAIIEEAGSEPSKLVSVRVYITDIEKWGEFNALYEKFVGEHKPAR